jgi:hypothetical protein
VARRAAQLSRNLLRPQAGVRHQDDPRSLNHRVGRTMTANQETQLAPLGSWNS